AKCGFQLPAIAHQQHVTGIVEQPECGTDAGDHHQQQNHQLLHCANSTCRPRIVASPPPISGNACSTSCSSKPSIEARRWLLSALSAVSHALNADCMAPSA